MALVKHEIDEIAGLREELDALEHPQFQFVRRSPGGGMHFTLLLAKVPAA